MSALITRLKRDLKETGTTALLVTVFLDKKMPDLKGIVRFDPEGSMFCAYTSDAGALKQFLTAFKDACKNEALIRDLFSRAGLV